jgi:hypothetical protein
MHYPSYHTHPMIEHVSHVKDVAQEDQEYSQEVAQDIVDDLIDIEIKISNSMHGFHNPEVIRGTYWYIRRIRNALVKEYSLPWPEDEYDSLMK